MRVVLRTQVCGAGLNQTQLAAKAGVSRKFVSEFELGRPRAELTKALSLFDAVDVRVSFFETKRPSVAVQVDLTRHKKEYAARVALPLRDRK